MWIFGIQIQQQILYRFVSQGPSGICSGFPGDSLGSVSLIYALTSQQLLLACCAGIHLGRRAVGSSRFTRFADPGSKLPPTLQSLDLMALLLKPNFWGLGVLLTLSSLSSSRRKSHPPGRCTTIYAMPFLLGEKLFKFHPQKICCGAYFGISSVICRDVSSQQGTDISLSHSVLETYYINNW